MGRKHSFDKDDNIFQTFTTTTTIKACVLKQEPEGSLGVSRDIGHFALCFFKNRRAQSSLYDLAKSCLKSGWDDVVACDRNLARDVSAPHKEATEKIAKAELADGLAIRIKADVNSKAEADLFGEICKSLEGSVSGKIDGKV